MKPQIIGREKAKYDSERVKIKAAKLSFPGKKDVEWEYVEITDVVVVLPVDEHENVYLVREWRLAWKQEVLQVPGGGCKSKSEKGRLVQAHHELREETGMDAKFIKKIGSYRLGANTKCEIHSYIATGLFPAPKAPDEYEFVKVIKMPFKKACDLFVHGKKPVPASSLITFLFAKELIN